jgi:hypothetical protein
MSKPKAQQESTFGSSYQGSTFNEVRKQVFSDPYKVLPQQKVTFRSFFQRFRNVLLKAAVRSLDDPSDIIPYHRKLVHPNGIALFGTWNITEKTPYTGYFSQGSQALIVVRCSTALSATKRGHYRGFGFVGKLFPTTDPTERVKTADFFAIDVFAGTKAAHFTDVELTNDVPTGFNIDALLNFFAGVASVLTFRRADGNNNFRELYPIAELGLPEGAKSVTPIWIMIRAWPGSGKADKADFRDELRVENYPNNTLRFEIWVADKVLPSGKRDVKQIGYIDLTESVASDSADHRLAFQHPRLRNDIKKK